ncbi:MAG: hypothetical protein IPL65_16315 [Lewinellaceae bacterium]|nr:hypothetical protein [Lewinellaceae bacterium]
MRYLFSLVLIASLTVVNAQKSKTGGPKTESLQGSMSFLPFALGFEASISNQSTVYVQMGMSANADFKKEEKGYRAGYYAVFPFIAMQGRYYYAMQRRYSMGRHWQGNSGPFLGLHAGVDFSPFREGYDGKPYPLSRRRESAGFTVAPVWGYQYTKDHFQVAVSVGPGLRFDRDGYLWLVAAGHFSLGLAMTL